jgi:glycosyltransferase involved in cell wall biosynthesis
VRPDVALVSPYPAPGRTHDGTSGVASYTANLARGLAFRGASVLVVAPDEPAAPPAHSDGDVAVVRSGPRGPLALSRAIRMASDRRPGVVHLQHEMLLFGGLSSLATMPMATRQLRKFERGAITTVHQIVDPRDVSREFMTMHRLRGPVTAARVAISAYQEMLASAGVVIVHEPGFLSQLPDSVVIPHGVERQPRLPRAQARQRLGLSDERRLVVLCFGFVAPYKGLEAALAVATRAPEVLMVVAGGDHPRHGPGYTETLERRWGDVARFTGWLSEEDIAAWHSAADVAFFGYPAPHSSSGAVSMAIGFGMPFLTSDALSRCMGLPPEVSVSLDGFELAERLRELADDRELLAKLRRASTRIVGRRSWAEVAERHLRLYQRVGSEATLEPALRVVSGDRGQVEVA